MRTRKAGEVRKTPRENQQRLLELRCEEGGTSAAMPVSFSIRFPTVRADSRFQFLISRIQLPNCHRCDFFERETMFRAVL